MRIDKIRLVEILESKIEPAYAEIEALKLTDKEFATHVLNFIRMDDTIKQLRDEAIAETVLDSKDSEDVVIGG